MTISDWPLILVDLETEEGITGRSYVGPHIVDSIRYLMPVIRDFGCPATG
jgi:mandelate racemase